MNRTYENIANQLKCTNIWAKINGDMSCISLRKTKHKNYGIFSNNAFTGIFIDGASINLSEAAAAGIVIIDGLMEH